MFTDDINSLLVRAREGDENAIKTVFRKTNDRLSYYAYKYLVDKSLVDDVISETFLNVIKYINSFDAKYGGLEWLIKIVRTVAQKFNGESLCCADISETEIPDTRDFIKQIDDKILIEGFTMELEFTERLYFHYYFVARLAISEIAEIMGVSRSVAVRNVKLLSYRLKSFAGRDETTRTKKTTAFPERAKINQK